MVTCFKYRSFIIFELMSCRTNMKSLKKSFLLFFYFFVKKNNFTYLFSSAPILLYPICICFVSFLLFLKIKMDAIIHAVKWSLMSLCCKKKKCNVMLMYNKNNL